MRPSIHAALLFALLFFGLNVAHAAPPSLNQLEQLEAFLECRDKCDHAKLATHAQCMAACPPQSPDWDKNKDSKLDDVDHTLAYLEYWDSAQICYEGGAVVPIQACGLANCLANHTADQCADADKDGLKAFQETLIGTSDAVANPACAANAECGGFASACSFVTNIDRSICRPRDCSATGGTCTAFHLETVSSDNDELLVRVVYDYSPVPATVLDLHLDFDQSALTLTDTRALAALTSRGKTIEARSVGTGKLRLLVFSPASSRAIATGPIAELLFTRISGSQSAVAFSSDDYNQQWSMAPKPGADLSNDALWGANVNVAARSANGPRMVLYYTFDNPTRPLSYQLVPTGQQLADLSFVCTKPGACTPQEAADKAALAARASAVQIGSVSLGANLPGVYGTGARIDGATQHLELPISLNGTGNTFSAKDQSFSVGFWAYHEANVSRAVALHGDLLFSHNHGTSELTRFGLLAIPKGSDTFDLAWFEGDLGDPNLPKTILASALTDRTWTHVGLAVDASAGTAQVYLNGAPTQKTALPIVASPAVQCPALTGSNTLSLHQQGAIDGGRAPEQLLFSSARNNLFGIERMEPRGLDRQSVLRLDSASAADPDYSSVVDRIVYVSSASGNYEVWVARGDGSQAQQITVGFGDTARNVFARRPHWAPDGSGIVFESNVFDVPAGDNTYARGSHLYYIPYDAIANRPVVTTGASTSTQLVYSTLLSTQTVLNYRLTKVDRNHTQATWLRGKFSDNTGIYLGELVLNTADRNFKEKGVARLRISVPINGTDAQALSAFSKLENAAEVSLLAANRQSPAGKPVVERLFLKKEWISYEPAQDITVQVQSSADGPIAVLTYTPKVADALCYDLDRDKLCNTATEDRNGDGLCDVKDCTASEIHDVYLSYDLEAVAPALDADGGVIITQGAALASANKQLRVVDVHEEGGDYLKLEVSSPINDHAIATGTELGRISLRNKGAASPVLAVLARKVRQQLFVKTNDAEPVAFTVGENDLERVLEAVFSPDGTRLALAGIQSARPVVAITQNLDGTTGLNKASIVPMRVEGLDWERVERIFPCNWAFGYRNPYSGFYVSSFRGAVDDFKVHSYARSVGAFASESARGHDRLALDGRDGPQSATVKTCATDLDCPSYQLCGTGGICQAQTCNPKDPYSCQRGVCSLMPVPVSLDTTAARWVCSVECSADSQCFQQECLNGPCRFCADTTQSCIECRETVQDVGGLKIAEIEGCPDRNSYSCDHGSCVTECYSFEDGNSRYLCDSTLEYCKQGRCALYDWSWPDFAPATFASAGESKFDLPGSSYTTAISQLYPVEITAYGVEDYGFVPEIMVEGHLPANQRVFGASVEWFDIGRVLVYNKTKTEATNRPYVVQTPYPIDNLRLRLITPPYENLNSASTGLRGRDKDFCMNADWSASDRTACYRRAAGSRASVGYDVSIATWEARKAFEERTKQEAGYDSNDQDSAQAYLRGGQPAVAIRGIKVLGNDILAQQTSNIICSYEGGTIPYAADGKTRRFVYFGDPSLEQSNQQLRFYANSVEIGDETPPIYVPPPPGEFSAMMIIRPIPTPPILPPEGSLGSGLVEFSGVSKKGWALLNCNFAHPTDDSQLAALTVPVNVTFPRIGPTVLDENGIKETANGCFVNVGDANHPAFEPCREADAVSFDPWNDEVQLHRTLNYDEFTSFGYDLE
jgi:hypothetical protein